MVEEEYQQRIQQFEGECRAQLRRGEQIGWARVACALAAAAALAGGWNGAWLSWRQGLGLGFAMAALFLACVAWHRRVRRAAVRARTLATLNQQAVARLRRQWGGLPSQVAPPECEQSPLAHDLDLFGKASLFQLVCTAATPQGRETLAQWLLQPAPPGEIAPRQAAMRELAPLLDWRQELEYRGLIDGGRFENPAKFLAWAEGSGGLRDRWMLRAYAYAGPALLMGAALLQNLGWTDRPWWSLLVVANLAVTLLTARWIHGIFAGVSAGEQSFAHYAWLMEWISSADFQATALQKLQQQLRTEDRPAGTWLRTLQRWITLSDLRLSPMVYGPIQAMTLWDLHVLNGIERWQSAVGSRVRGWLAALAEIEALASLAALAHAEPSWASATLHDEPVLRAQELGHPLLPSATRVNNNLEIGPPGTFLLVTGSNMSGKSTLLRSVGVNVVLAQAGGPVCAAAMWLPSITLGASMRVQDSLAEATSYFMAELKRLKQIIEEASAGQRMYLYLLDEILHGTNSHERRFAVRAVLGRLLELRAIGAVSTHDLDLADAPELDNAARRVHFRETIVDTSPGRQMVFDYQMRPGLATTTNALVLLEMVGLWPHPQK